MKEASGTVILRYGNTNTFYIPGYIGGLLVDTDYAGTMPGFFRAIGEAGIQVKDILYVLATHYHPDHAGLIGELQQMGVKLLVADGQQGSIRFSDRIFSRDRVSYRPVNLDSAVVISCEDSREFLEKLGIEGEIVSTPSHSKDSISLLLDNGECMVGDLEPKEYMDAYPDDEAPDLRADWAKIMSRRPRKVFYGHANEKVIR